MSDWTYRVPPGLLVTVRSRTRPVLLSHCLGEETAPDGQPALLIDLAGPKGGRPRALLSVDESSGATSVRGVYKAVPWRCRVVRRDGSWVCEFASPLLREYLAMHIVLLPALRRLLLERGVALVAGAGFAREDGATLVAGLTGRGKTTVLLGALERGARLVGDEYLGLSEDGELMPVIRSLALRRSTFALAPETLRRLGARQRLALRAAEVVARLSGGVLQPLVHVPPEVLVRQARGGAARARLRRLFWLEDSSGTAVEARAPMEPRDGVARLALVQAAHDIAYGDLGAFLGGPEYPGRWREAATRALHDVTCERVALAAGRRLGRAALDHVLGPRQLERARTPGA